MNEKRIVAEVPIEVYRAAKIKSFEEGKTLKTYIKDLIISDSEQKKSTCS